MSTFTGEKAPKGATCPTCGLDIGGCDIGITRDGKTTWDRPVRYDQGPTGTWSYSGGLTHVEGGERCKPVTLFSRATCRSCNARIAWLKTPAGRSMPVDVEPSLSGNIIIENAVAIVSPARAIEARAAGRDTYVSHYATCPQANEHRRKQVKS